ncbi:MAG TPA: type II secretion system F family protein [Microbacterium sp.]|uniref:type II secretion system F family protein n=1 Tax=Microbacterium sp. TaxID=51671 RepID=UPI002B58FCD4|nr:type II secretion system F family protein [Microbacterium sp.]HWI31088.1 type II secretion system F family protein [Microbacterium sp.]
MMPAGWGTDIALALVLGGALGIGIWSLLALAPRWGAPTLARRIAPYVRDVTDPRGATLWSSPSDPAGALVGGLRALWQGARERFSSALGGSDTIARRLTQAGWAIDVPAFRGRQLAWAIGGIVLGGLVIVGLALAGTLTVAGVLVPPVLAVIGLALCDAHLTTASRARVARIEDELPTVLEFLALCLSAGESLLDSLRRIGSVGSGELTLEVRTAVVAVSTGSSLSDALGALAHRLQVAALTRAVDHLVAAIDRGAPLALVLQAQAADAREEAKRGLIERAGRKEIYMLIPLVFLILPLSVLFAVFPGVFMLRLGVG